MRDVYVEACFSVMLATVALVDMITMGSVFTTMGRVLAYVVVVIKYAMVVTAALVFTVYFLCLYFFPEGVRYRVKVTMDTLDGGLFGGLVQGEKDSKQHYCYTDAEDEYFDEAAALGHVPTACHLADRVIKEFLLEDDEKLLFNITLSCDAKLLYKAANSDLEGLILHVHDLVRICEAAEVDHNHFAAAQDRLVQLYEIRSRAHEARRTYNSEKAQYHHDPLADRENVEEVPYVGGHVSDGQHVNEAVRHDACDAGRHIILKAMKAANGAGKTILTILQYRFARCCQICGIVTRAMSIFQKLAAQGHLDAKYRVAQLHEKSGRLHDAMCTYKAAADRGHSCAAYRYGSHCEDSGRGRDAVRYLGIAAFRGHADAQQLLACVYRILGRAKDQRQMLHLLAKSSKRRPRRPRRRHLLTITKGQSFKQALLSGIREVWLGKTAGSFNVYKCGVHYDFFLCSCTYLEGMTVSRCTKLAALYGHVDSQRFVGTIYDSLQRSPFGSLLRAFENGNKYDEKLSRFAREAVRFFEMAAVQGDKRAQYELGMHYFTGDGVGKDRIEAERWWRRAAKQGNADAQFELGQWYLTESNKRVHKGASLAQAAADQGHYKACRLVDKVLSNRVVRACDACGRRFGLKKCSNCRWKFYCGVECQTEDWPSHREECRHGIVFTPSTSGIVFTAHMGICKAPLSWW